MFKIPINFNIKKYQIPKGQFAKFKNDNDDIIYFVQTKQTKQNIQITQMEEAYDTTCYHILTVIGNISRQNHPIQDQKFIKSFVRKGKKILWDASELIKFCRKFHVVTDASLDDIEFMKTREAEIAKSNGEWIDEMEDFDEDLKFLPSDDLNPLTLEYLVSNCIELPADNKNQIDIFLLKKSIM